MSDDELSRKRREKAINEDLAAFASLQSQLPGGEIVMPRDLAEQLGYEVEEMTLSEALETIIEDMRAGGEAATRERIAMRAFVLAVRRQALEEALSVVDRVSGGTATEWHADVSGGIRALPVTLDGPAPEVKP